MGFLRSLYSGVSGLRNHQTMMDVIGNNVSNINTIGFKGSRVNFSESFAQTLRGASSPTALNGGSNPMQIGLGMDVSSIDTNFSVGNTETTGVKTHLALQGSGFFIAKEGGKNYYTRVGAFTFNSLGQLVNGEGAVVQGKIANAAGVLPAGTSLQNIAIPKGMTSAPQASSEIKLTGNLDASAKVGDTTNSVVTVFDSLGTEHNITLTFTKTAVNAWDWKVTFPTGSPAVPTAGSDVGTLTFNADGTVKTFANTLAPPADTSLTFAPGTGASNVTIKLLDTANLNKVALTQTTKPSSVFGEKQDGYASGALNAIDFENDGTIRGSFSNGQRQVLGQLLVANFNNPNGLARGGGSLYDTTSNSGVPIVGTVETVSDGNIQAGALEQSNVDLAEEFTKMIVAQRGFQANAKVITTSDEFLQELMSIKR